MGCVRHAEILAYAFRDSSPQRLSPVAQKATAMIVDLFAITLGIHPAIVLKLPFRTVALYFFCGQNAPSLLSAAG